MPSFGTGRSRSAPLTLELCKLCWPNILTVQTGQETNNVIKYGYWWSQANGQSDLSPCDPNNRETREETARRRIWFGKSPFRLTNRYY